MPPPASQRERDIRAAIWFMSKDRRYERALRAHYPNALGLCAAHTRDIEWPCFHHGLALDARDLACRTQIPTPREPTR